MKSALIAEVAGCRVLNELDGAACSAISKEELVTMTGLSLLGLRRARPAGLPLCAAAAWLGGYRTACPSGGSRANRHMSGMCASAVSPLGSGEAPKRR